MPVPTRVVTLRCLARPVSPPVSRVTTPSFQPRRASRSMVGEAKASPAWVISLVSAITLAACSSALDGMQPTLRHTPPSGPRESTITTCLAEVGGAERGGVAARPGAQHQHLGVHVALGPGVRGGRADRGSGPVVSGRRARRRPVPGRRRQLLLRACPVPRRSGASADRFGGLAGDRFLRRFRTPRPGDLDGADDRALRDRVTDRQGQRDDRPGDRGRHVEGGLVALQGQQRVFGRDGVARGDEDLDDRDVGEVADVRDADLLRGHAALLPGGRGCGRTVRGAGAGRPRAGSTGGG